MIRVLVVGCGIVGATIAYELAQIPGLQITVLDRQPPAQGSTGAALGVLMGAISQKVKGRGWRLRQASMLRYETLIPELEAATGQIIPYNRQGILLLRMEPTEAEAERWRSLLTIRQRQGWSLELWDVADVQRRCPHLAPPVPAVYSPDDRQLHPARLTAALVAAAQQRGVQFRWDAPVTALHSSATGTPQLQTPQGLIEADWVILAAGLGTPPITQSYEAPPDPQAPHTPLMLGPVLGQGMAVSLPHPLGDPSFQPVITGNDIHLVPLGHGRYWVGATVEFPPETGELVAEAAALDQVWNGAIALCPALAQATLERTWSGLRPRPANRPAPVIDYFPGFPHVILATGHYRNGVLLAPATADRVRVLMGLGDRLEILKDPDGTAPSP